MRLCLTKLRKFVHWSMHCDTARELLRVNSYVVDQVMHKVRVNSYSARKGLRREKLCEIELYKPKSKLLQYSSCMSLCSFSLRLPSPLWSFHNLEPSKLEGCRLALRRCVEARCQDVECLSTLSVLCLVVALSDCI